MKTQLSALDTVYSIRTNYFVVNIYSEWWEVEMNSAPHFRVSRGLFGPGLRHMMASWTPGTSETHDGIMDARNIRDT